MWFITIDSSPTVAEGRFGVVKRSLPRHAIAARIPHAGFLPTNATNLCHRGM